MSNRGTGLSSIVFGLYLLLVFSLGSMKPTVDVGFAALTPTDLLFPIVLVGWIVGIVAGGCSFRWQREFPIFALYLLALTISAIFSVNPGFSFARLPGAAYLVLLAVIGSNLVTTFDRLRVSILAWIAGAILPLLAGLIAILFFYFDPGNRFLPDLTYHYGAVPVGNFPRVGSMFVSPSIFCNYLTVTLIFTLLSAKLRWISRAIAVAIAFAIAVCAVFTVSIGLGGVVLAVGLWLWITTSNRTVARTSLAIGFAVALAFLAIAPFALVDQAGSFLGGLEPSSRLLIWSDAFRTFLADPVTGSGLGTAAANVTFHNFDGTWSLLTDAHNSFLSVGAQAGIPGIATLAAIAFVIMKSALGESEDHKDRGYILRCLGIAFVTAFVYEGMMGSFEEARHLWVLIGLILAASTFADPPDESLPVHRA